MLSSKLVRLTSCIKYTTKSFHKSATCGCRPPKFENPYARVLRILKNDFKNFKKLRAYKQSSGSKLMLNCPNHVDVVIIGGGAMGSSVAYWIKEMSGEDGLRVAVVEKDPTYATCSSALSVGGLRQQFSLPENIQMSLFGAEFLRTLKRRFGKEATVNFTPAGYLILASEEGAQQLIDNSKLQNNLGAVNDILSADKLKERFPWMNVDDVAVGCLGLEKEGWFDPWLLLNLFRTGAKELGAQFVHGEVVAFGGKDIAEGGASEAPSKNELHIKLPDGTVNKMEFACCVIAAGAESADIAKLATIGTGEGILSLALPVEKRKRYVYRFDCQGEPPGINSPMVIDHTGAYFRRDGLGGSFICGRSPDFDAEPPTTDLEVDHNYFDEHVWPRIANRVPAFNSVKVQSAWSGFYEYNFYDENGIIGSHPYFDNIYFATGFSGHGIQQSPAVGRAIAELILEGRFVSIDLRRFDFNRFLADKPMYEIGII